MVEHFAGKDPLSHVMEKRVEGMVSISEVHGTEMPGHLSAAADAAKETTVVLLLAWIALTLLNISPSASFAIFISIGFGWVAWKGGRSGRLGWTKLERLHRLIEQEKYEIEHHRPQEREELLALYRAKGFEGKLLDDVVDVLMADQDRLLKVMLEEEMGLTLQAYEHPLQQTLGAIAGAAISLGVCSLFYYFLPLYGMWIAAFMLIGSTSCLAALYEKNKVIPAAVWDISLAVLAVGIAYFLYNVLR